MFFMLILCRTFLFVKCIQNVFAPLSCRDTLSIFICSPLYAKNNIQTQFAPTKRHHSLSFFLSWHRKIALVWHSLLDNGHFTILYNISTIHRSSKCTIISTHKLTIEDYRQTDSFHGKNKSRNNKWFPL